MVNSEYIRIGTKKIYFIDDTHTVKALIDCDLFPQVALLSVPMTFAQRDAIIKRTECVTGRQSIQDILPDASKDVREVFITGTTPAEWDETFNGQRKHWRHYKANGYVFDHDQVTEAELDEHDDALGMERPDARTVLGKPVEVLNPEDLNEAQS